MSCWRASKTTRGAAAGCSNGHTGRDPAARGAFASVSRQYRDGGRRAAAHRDTAHRGARIRGRFGCNGDALELAVDAYMTQKRHTVVARRWLLRPVDTTRTARRVARRLPAT